MVLLNNSWDTVLGQEFSKEYYLKLRAFLKEEYFSHTIHPDMHDIFNALKKTSYEQVKVVILGQDPYHNDGQAHGMAFSVKRGVEIPPSLVNIYKEICSDCGITMPLKNGNLEPWAEQGVLLLNTVLTVRHGQANSHASSGWQIFTDTIIKKLSDRNEPVIFMLWGNNAKAKKSLIDTSRHYILESVHPSPLSAYNGFFGCKHFSKANEILKKLNVPPINWQLND